MIEAGTKGHIEAIVTSEMTARAIGSGELEVLATPKLAALIEEAAWRSVSGALDEGQTTVGTKLELSHLAPTPTDMQLSCDTTLASVDGKRLTFSFEAHDGEGRVAEGTHERFIVDSDRFFAKASGRAKE